jgi:hypothetical protein
MENRVNALIRCSSHSGMREELRMGPSMSVTFFYIDVGCLHD